ncbi:MAG TPA: hypothetical protein VIV12_01125, partial [Streptosporangiaceae bacterium]
AAAHFAPSNVTALLASGVTALAIVGGLAYHVRADLGRPRPRPRSREIAPVASVERQSPADSTGPIPLALNPASAPGHSLDAVPVEALPLYRATVESLRWDPAAPASRGARAESG